jgi:uncharacterized membrane protein YccC
VVIGDWLPTTTTTNCDPTSSRGIGATLMRTKPFLHNGTMRSTAAAARGQPLSWIWPAAHQIQEFAGVLWAGRTPLLFGLRLWASVCLALWVAYWLELDNAYWAATFAAIVCQPSLGASLRKASHGMVGTIVGAVAIVVLSAAFPQSRAVFLLGLALWGAACCLTATLLRNYASYAAALAGYTAAIIAADELGNLGGTDGQVFMLAITRATEICIGIVSAGIVLAGTDFGSARRRLTEQFASALAEVGAGFLRALTLPGSMQAATRSARRGLIRRVTGLDSAVDEAIGESSEICYRSDTLQHALDGLFTALAGWSMIANHMAQLSDEKGREDAAEVLKCIPPELQSALAEGKASTWITGAPRLRAASEAAAHALVALPASTPSLRLLADRAAGALASLSHALNGVALLNDPMGGLPRSHTKKLRVPDLLPALVNALRALITIGAVSLFWIVTVWPGGALAIAFAAMNVILFSPRGDLAPTAATSFLLGTILTSVLAAIVKFALLPQLDTFTGFSLALGLVLVPLGALAAQPWQTAVFSAAIINFFPILSPANQMTYDTVQFYNSALAINVGVTAAVLGMVLLPQLSPAYRTGRLLTLSLRDFRRLAIRPSIPSVDEWIGHVSVRLAVLPDKAEPLQFAQMVTALSAGAEIIRLRSLASRFGFGTDLNPALCALAQGRNQAAIAQLAEADRVLAAPDSAGIDPEAAVRARASICLLSETLSRHAAYFDAEAPR